MQVRILLLFLALPFAATGQVFTEVAQSSGIDFLPVALSYMGGGVAWFDYDNDGWEDLYMTGCSQPDKLYRNLGDGSFEDVSDAAGIIITQDANTQGVTTADVDRDGDVDVFVTTWRYLGTNDYAPNYLLLNNGDGTFSNATEAAGLTMETFSVSAAFLDINSDGWIDLWVGAYVIDPGFVYDDKGMIIGFDHVCDQDRLYLGGIGGVFSLAPESYGAQNAGCTLALRGTDADMDGDTDLLIANDFGEWGIPNKFYQNAFPEASLNDVASVTGSATQMYAMGIATGDYDHDYDLDHYITNLGSNVLLDQWDPMLFDDVAALAGIQNSGWDGLLSTSWATGFADFDHDTWEDLFVVNGHVSTIDPVDNHVFDPNKLYRNLGDGTFEDVSDASGFADVGVGRGGALCDYDKDGDLDVVVMNISNPAAPDPEAVRLYRNDTGTGNWLALDLSGTTSNLEAIGAQIEVHSNGLMQLREISGGGDTHCSQHSRKVHVGLGEASVVDSVVVHWPSGLVSQLQGPDINTCHSMVEPGGTSVPASALPSMGLFPSPSTGLLQLSFPLAEANFVRIFNLQGQLMVELDLNVSQFTFDAHAWTAGTYVVYARGYAPARWTLLPH